MSTYVLCLLFGHRFDCLVCYWRAKIRKVAEIVIGFVVLSYVVVDDFDGHGSLQTVSFFIRFCFDGNFIVSGLAEEKTNVLKCF